MIDDTLPTLADASRVLWRAYLKGTWLGAPRAQPVLYAFEREPWFGARDHLAAQLPAQLTERWPRRLPPEATAAGVGVLILLGLIRGEQPAPSWGATLIAPPRFRALGERCVVGALATQIAASAVKAERGGIRCAVPLAVWMNASAGLERRGVATGQLHGPLAPRALLGPDVERAILFGETLFAAGAGAEAQTSPQTLSSSPCRCACATSRKPHDERDDPPLTSTPGHLRAAALCPVTPGRERRQSKRNQRTPDPNRRRMT